MKIILSIGIALLLLVCCTSKQKTKTDTSSTPSTTISISQARGLPLGSEVTIQGTITVASGTFSSSRPYGYAVQDSSAGIYIIDSTATAKAAYELGESVKLTGIIGESNDLLIINELIASKEGKGNTITPISIKTGNVNRLNEGLIIQTSGIIDSLMNDQPYGYKIYINDGSGPLNIYINASTGMLNDTTQWRINDSISVIGFSAQYDNEYESDPRMKADLKVFPKN